MVLGAPAMLGDVYLLILGGLMSAVSIVTKTLVELDTDARFGYDENISIRQHTSYISRQHTTKTSAYVSIRHIYSTRMRGSGTTKTRYV